MATLFCAEKREAIGPIPIRKDPVEAPATPVAPVTAPVETLIVTPVATPVETLVVTPVTTPVVTLDAHDPVALTKLAILESSARNLVASANVTKRIIQSVQDQMTKLQWATSAISDFERAGEMYSKVATLSKVYSHQLDCLYKARDAFHCAAALAKDVGGAG
jgi:hypothetical protein